MPQAIVITLEKPMPTEQSAYAKAASGKVLAREIDRLDSAVPTKGDSVNIAAFRKPGGPHCSDEGGGV